jgi:VanZ family protein
MPKLRALLKSWLPPLIWMAVIFSASADSKSEEHSSRYFEPLLRWLFPRMSPEHIGLIHYDFRKFCHLAEYAVLALLLWRAIRQADGKKQDLPAAPRRSTGGWRWAEAGLALSIVFLYGASDELHQVFIPNRTAQISDVLIDTGGGAAGLLALWFVFNWRKRLKK